MSSSLILSLATVPDVSGLRRLHALPDELIDDEVAEFAWQRCRANGESDILPVHLQRIVQVSGVLRVEDHLQWVSLSGPESSILLELQALLAQAEERVVWSLPHLPLCEVLGCRAMLSQIELPLYAGATDLASDLSSGGLPLNEMAVLARLPWRQELDQRLVWQAVCAGDLARVEALSMARAITVHLLYLRFRRLRGELDAHTCLQELALVRQSLQLSDSAHLQAYLTEWSSAD